MEPDAPVMSRADERRAHLLETARGLFIARGFHQTGVAQIAAASGIKVGQIYRDFSAKEDIIAAICERDVAQWLDEQALATAVDAGDVKAVRAWMDRFLLVDYPVEDSRLMSEIVAETGRNPRIAELNRSIDLRVRHSLGIALSTIVPRQSGCIQSEPLIDFILAMGMGIMMRRTLDPDLKIEPLFAYVTQIIDQQISAI